MSKKCGLIKQALGSKVGIVDTIKCNHPCSEVIRQNGLIICTECNHLILGSHPPSEDIKKKSKSKQSKGIRRNRHKHKTGLNP